MNGVIMLAEVIPGQPAPLPEMSTTTCTGCHLAVWAMPSDLAMIAEGVTPMCMRCAALVTVMRNGDITVAQNHRGRAELEALGYQAVVESDAAMLEDIKTGNRRLRRARQRQRAKES